MEADVSHEQEHRDRAQRPVRDEVVWHGRENAPHRSRADDQVDADEADHGQRDPDRDAQHQKNDDGPQAGEGESEVAHFSAPERSSSITWVMTPGSPRKARTLFQPSTRMIAPRPIGS